MHKRLIFVLALALSLGAVSRPSAALDIFVIAHADVNIQAGELRDVYLGNKRFAGSVKLVPADNAEIQGEFLAKLLRLDAEKYGNLWIKKNFREGTNPPVVKANDAEMIEFIRHTRGAIGYVSALSSGVKLIGKF